MKTSEKNSDEKPYVILLKKEFFKLVVEKFIFVKYKKHFKSGFFTFFVL